MPAQTNSDFDNLNVISIGEKAQALFSLADTPEEVASLRDEVLRRIAETAQAARQERAAEAGRQILETSTLNKSR